MKTTFKITEAQAVENFESVSAQLIASAPTEKAAAFAEKITTSIRARGAAWIHAHVAELQIYSDEKNSFCPVADNRMYFIAAFQSAAR